MAIENGSDPRAIRSRQALINAMWSCLENGNFNPSITDIVKLAQVSRPTFYQHFTQVSDLIRAVVGERLRKLFEHAEQTTIPPGSIDETAELRMTILLQELQQRRDIYLPVFQGPVAVPIFCDIVNFLATTFLSNSPLKAPLNEGVDTIEAKARAEFIGAGVTWRVVTWLNSNLEGENELAPTINRLALNVRQAAGCPPKTSLLPG